MLLERYLSSDATHTLTLHYFDRAWPDTPSKADIRSLQPQMTALMATPPTLSQCLPHTAMWAKIHEDYTPSTHPSHITCTLLVDGTPPPVILMAMTSCSHLVSSTIFCLTVTHCFDADYSDWFCPRADDVTTCPYTHSPPKPPLQASLPQTSHVRLHLILLPPDSSTPHPAHLHPPLHPPVQGMQHHFVCFPPRHQQHTPPSTPHPLSWLGPSVSNLSFFITHQPTTCHNKARACTIPIYVLPYT